MRTIGLAVFSLMSSAALAQGPAPAADPLTGKAALGYLSTSGNTDSTSTNASLAVDWDRGGNWTHHWTALAISARTEGVQTAEAYAAGYKAQRDFSETSYLFAAADWRQDRFSGYDKQVSETVGYGRRIIDSMRQTLALEGGIGAKQSDLVDGTTLDEGIVRGGLDYVLRISDASEFNQKFLVEIGDDNRYTESTSAIKARLVGDLSLVVSYVIKNNSDVPVGIEKTDRFTAISIEYGF